MVVSDQVSVRVVAEGGVGRGFAVADLVVSAFVDVEDHGSVSGRHGIAHLIAPRSLQRASAAAPVVHFPLLQVHVVGVVPCDQRHTGWPILTLHVGDRFGDRHHFLLGEIGDVVRFFLFAGGGRLGKSERIKELGEGTLRMVGGGVKGSRR